MVHGQEKVTITVGEGESAKSYTLPKELACYQSKIFNAAFNGRFNEASTLTYSLPDHLPKTFEMVLQSMRLGTVCTAEEDNGPLSTTDRTDQITKGMNFCVLVDMLDMLGPFDSYMNKIRSHLRASSNAALVPAHIQEAFTKLPQGSPLHQLLAYTCVRSWIVWTQLGNRGMITWGFEWELKAEAFAADLLKTVARARKGNKLVVVSPGKYALQVTTDPISGAHFMYY